MAKSYSEAYRSKLRTPQEIMRMVESGDLIVAGQFAGNPQGLLSAVGSLREEVKDVTITYSSSMVSFPFLEDPALRDRVHHQAWFYGGPERKAQNVSFIPGGLGLVAAKTLPHRTPKMFWGMSSPMDSHGNFNLCMSIAYEMEMLEAADIVVIEVNDQAPRVFGENTVPFDRVDFIVEHSTKLPTATPAPESAVDDQIGRYVASLVEDGSSIQLGIGGIPDAVGRHLAGKRELSVHTELITDSMMRLYEAGVITNRGKRLWPGKLVGTLIFGSRELYDFVNDNPVVELKRGSVINNPFIIALNDKQVSINTALQVDLSGNVASETLGGRQYSGTGGQFETAYGAQLSKGGKSIIALRSTAKKGTVSTIVPALAAGTAVTLGRNDVDYVVTEYGIAELQDLSIKQRVEALTRIAHPAFRDGLLREAAALTLR